MTGMGAAGAALLAPQVVRAEEKEFRLRYVLSSAMYGGASTTPSPSEGCRTRRPFLSPG